MENKPAIIVSGNKNNMQPWYEEKCKRSLEELAHLADTIRRPGDAPNNGWQSKQEEMEHHLALAVRSVLVLSIVSCGHKGNIEREDIDLIVDEGYEGYKKVMEKIASGEADWTFVEIMGCPGGCVNGGGQPIQPASVRNFVDLKGLRGKALYEADKNLPLRKSHESEAVKTVYAEYFEKPGSHIAHEVLHTHYVPRGIYNEK